MIRKQPLREVAKFTNCTFSISLWGKHAKDSSEYTLFVYWQEDNTEEGAVHEAYELEGDLRDAYKVYEGMIQVLKDKAKYVED